ncbi:putative uncharacterized protein [Waddlia chondrophila 2032/99]|uniref:Uncharacterized protein n=2 Tax=Waddlia chondrophila TaxID=71667 RepID=D6YTC4_WADCW|nr:hypothetical protein [Waddlia chondrophila]ADI37385.1 hypothetical protein wcw_0008 [Waddlia chondrophila WSU 86-1044]CCB91628.1 putative uncharacterized protein [Waddlia chondrophila 2032/99]
MTKTTKNVPIPKQVSLLAEAIQCADPEAARSLVKKAFDVMNCNDDLLSGRRIDPIAIDSVIALIRGVNPQDTVEMILASQFVATHFQAMNKMASDRDTDTSHGMMLMRLSHQALETLQKYRQKGSNINVNYWVHNEGQAVLQTNIGKNLGKKGE